MTPCIRAWKGASLIFLGLGLAAPAAAQIQENLQAYTGQNAAGYLKPLADLLGADLSTGVFYNGYVPKSGFHLSIEFRYLYVSFAEADRTFAATTEGDFQPQQTVAAPTIIGSRRAVIVPGSGGTAYAFPGGLDVGEFQFVTPQVRIGAMFGTEALVRSFTWETGDSDLDDITLFGLGIRHSLSQYLPLPFDTAISGLWQTFSIGKGSTGEPVLSTDTWSGGIQVSRRFAALAPYAGFSINSYRMDIEYTVDSFGKQETISVSTETDTDYRTTFGLTVGRGVVSATAEVNFAVQNSYSLGLAFGK